jgi:LCP family protein required for cell wall assembly
MKTTLKRGIGRSSGADGNGNGRANGHVALPPHGRPEMSRYRVEPPRRRGVARTLLVAVGALFVALLVVGGGLAGGFYLYLEEGVAHRIAPKSEQVRVAAEKLDAVPAGEPAIALAIGYDKRLGGEGEVNGARSDTVMLLRADPDTDSVSMLSFPRDLVVPIHCPGKPVYENRINEAYSDCGVQGTVETVRALTGLPINYLVTVNFHGFKQLVAKLGGVWMDVDRRYYNPEGTGYASIDLQPGYQKLNGQDALDFVRYRHTDSDIYRLARQQLFVQAFKQALTSQFSPTDLPKVIRVVTDNVEVGQAGNEEFDVQTLLSYGLFLFNRPNLYQSKIDMACYGEDDVAAITVDGSCIRNAVSDFANPDVDASEKATLTALGKKPKSDTPPPKETTVVVLNGNGVPGAAADASYQLAQRAYVMLTPPDNMAANAPTQDHYRSKVLYDDQQPRAEAAAKKLATLLGQADIEAFPVDEPEVRTLANGAMVVLVLGQLFDGNVAPVPEDKTPARTPPSVVKNADMTLAAVREAQKRVRFPLLVPSVVEQSSRLSTESGSRLYSMAGHRTLRLTFVHGGGEYWGIQMVKWREAPAIQAPTRKLYVKGRRYELHYSGSHIHMVVLRQAGATYWVVNTILNTLTNETMIAIARGLEPIAKASA